MDNVLARKFGFARIVKFTMPTIIMMVFMSLYTMVDGVFVSRFVGTTALSAVNIVYPAINIVIAIAIMLATGGSAVIAKKMGEGKAEKARANFSLITVIGVVTGVLLLALCLLFLEPMLKLLGAQGALLPLCMDYAGMLAPFLPFAILQMLFQYFFVTAGKPGLGLTVIVAGGLANMALDYVFIVPMKMGIGGAALATGIGYAIPAVAGLLFFSLNRKGTLYFTKPVWEKGVLLSSCLNGSSEMVTNLSMAVTTFLFNMVMLKYLGEDGVAAITIVLYSQFLLTAVYLGYSSGISSVFSYNYGAENIPQLKKLFKISMLLIGVSSLVIFAVSLLAADGIIVVFTRRDSPVFPIARNGFFLFSFSYLFIGLNIFASALFTAFSNGKISALISFLRTFVFIVLGILLLPLALKVNGVWLAVPLAELLTAVVSIVCIFQCRKRYRYM